MTDRVESINDYRSVDVRVLGQFEDKRFVNLCRQSAERFKVAGWVKEIPGQNSADLHLEGMGYQVDQFMSWLRDGADGIVFSRIEMSESVKEGCVEFVIRNDPYS